jgi:hypothetical protein
MVQMMEKEERNMNALVTENLVWNVGVRNSRE